MPYLCIAFETEVYGRLAQLVQSICLTSRGSAVRIRQRPHKIQALSFIKRAFSSAGSEHLPYKQRVGGSNPSTPTPKRKSYEAIRETFLFYIFCILRVWYDKIKNRFCLQRMFFLAIFVKSLKNKKRMSVCI